MLNQLTQLALVQIVKIIVVGFVLQSVIVIVQLIVLMCQMPVVFIMDLIAMQLVALKNNES